jgi:flavin-dependent dehydrogenase
MSARRDLLVLGGGLAGASVARLAAAAGLRVLLVERERFPRDKVCGEFVSAEGCAVLERAGLLDELLAAGGQWMGEVRLTDARGRSLDVPLPRLHEGRNGLGISRAVMDSALLEAAGHAGAEVRQREEAVEPLLEGGRVVGMRLRRVGSTRKEDVRASVVVAADGRRSVLARMFHPHLGDPSRSGLDSWFGHKVHLAASRAELERRVELHLFDGGYAGLAPVEGERINLCMMATVGALRASGGSPDRLWRERVQSNPALRRAVGDSRICSTWKSVGPLRFGVRRPAARGVLFVGDAAGTVDPFCGEGMSHALLGAEIAWPVLRRAAEAGALEDDLASSYTSDWERAFARVTRHTRWLGRLFARPRVAATVLGPLRGWAAPLASRLVAATRTGYHSPMISEAAARGAETQR